LGQPKNGLKEKKATVVDFLPKKNLGFGSFIFGWVEVETTKYPKTKILAP